MRRGRWPALTGAPAAGSYAGLPSGQPGSATETPAHIRHTTVKFLLGSRTSYFDPEKGASYPVSVIIDRGTQLVTNSKVSQYNG